MNIIRYRKLFFSISGVLVLASVVALFIPPALTPGIDFSGGTALTLEFDEQVAASEVERVLDSVGHDEAVIQSTTDNTFFLRVSELREPGRNDAGVVTTPGEQAEIEAALATLGTFNITEAVTVSGIIGAENVRNAIIAVIVASIAILFYVTWAFRRVPSPFRYGMAAGAAALAGFAVQWPLGDTPLAAMLISGAVTGGVSLVLLLLTGLIRPDEHALLVNWGVTPNLLRRPR